MLVDIDNRTGLPLKRSARCDLDPGLATMPAGPRINVPTKGVTRSLRTERKPDLGVDRRSAASRAVMVPRAAPEQPEIPVSEPRSNPRSTRTETPDLAASNGRPAQLVTTEIEDDDVVRRCIAGDRDCFEQLVRRHSQRVFNIIASFFRRRDIVEDIAQEVFVKSYVSLSSYTLGRSFEAWLARITVNACYDHLRAERRRGEQFFPQDPDREGDWLDLQMLEAAIGQHASAERQREAADISGRLLSKL